MSDRSEQVLWYFNRDTKDHVLTILRDDGLYRHIRYAKPGCSFHHVEVITFPGYLAYVGDMGAFTFQRLPDMFRFFRSPTGDVRHINPGYWSEKLEAVDRSCNYREFDRDTAKEEVLAAVREQLDEIGEYADDCAPEVLEKWKADTLAEVTRDMTWAPSDEYGFREWVRDELDETEFEGPPRAWPTDGISMETWSVDLSERSLQRYTVQYLWCLYAIVKIIALYDAQTAPVESGKVAE